MARKMIVGVVGGSRRPAAIAQTECEEYLQLAIEIGEMVADCNCAILTGATLGNGTGRVNGNAVRAAVTKGGFAIGILPKAGRQPAREASVVYDSAKGVLEVRTNLTSARRNFINGVTPDVLIALPGGCGTAAEVAVALSLGRPVIYLRSFRYLSDLSTDAVANKLRRINEGNRQYIEVETVSRLELIGTDCHDINAVKVKLQELGRNARNDVTPYPDNVEGAPGKLDFERAFSQAVLSPILITPRDKAVTTRQNLEH